MGKKGENCRPGRRAVNWDAEPFGVFLGSSPTAVVNFTSQQDALDYVNRLSLTQKGKAYVGRLSRVVVETTVKINSK